MRTNDAYGQNVWETLANKDAFWAACTSGKRRIDWGLEDFLATGELEVSWASRVAQEGEFYPSRRSLAVDFGCGPGRLTGALKERFQRVVGIDTSEAMLGVARSVHPEEGIEFSESIKKLENDSVDLVYSTFVLQHLTRDEVRDCFHEFTRILHAGGLLIFQYPARPRWTVSGIAFFCCPFRFSPPYNDIYCTIQESCPCHGWLRRRLLSSPHPAVLPFSNIRLGLSTARTGRTHGISLKVTE